MNKELTNMDIVEVLKDFSEKTDRQFEKINQKIDDFRVEVNQKFVEVDQRLDYHETWLNRIETRSNNIENNVARLVDLLKDKEIISVRELTRFFYPKVIN